MRVMLSPAAWAVVVGLLLGGVSGSGANTLLDRLEAFKSRPIHAEMTREGLNSRINEFEKSIDFVLVFRKVAYNECDETETAALDYVLDGLAIIFNIKVELHEANTLFAQPLFPEEFYAAHNNTPFVPLRKIESLLNLIKFSQNQLQGTLRSENAESRDKIHEMFKHQMNKLLDTYSYTMTNPTWNVVMAQHPVTEKNMIARSMAFLEITVELYHAKSDALYAMETVGAGLEGLSMLDEEYLVIYNLKLALAKMIVNCRNEMLKEGKMLNDIDAEIRTKYAAYVESYFNSYIQGHRLLHIPIMPYDPTYDPTFDPAAAAASARALAYTYRIDPEDMLRKKNQNQQRRRRDKKLKPLAIRPSKDNLKKKKLKRQKIR